MIYIKNTQRLFHINKEHIKKDLEHILEFLDYPDFDISIWFMSEKKIQHYNAHYRQQDKPTDVLSFPFHPDIKAGKRIIAYDPEEKNLGDILMAPAYIDRNKETWNQTFDERIRTLLVHAVCHLLGYDHETDAQYKKMHAEEQRILAMLHKAD